MNYSELSKLFGAPISTATVTKVNNVTLNKYLLIIGVGLAAYGGYCLYKNYGEDLFRNKRPVSEL